MEDMSNHATLEQVLSQLAAGLTRLLRGLEQLVESEEGNERELVLSGGAE